MLVAKNAVPKEALPLYLESWLQKGSDVSMFTSEQFKKFNLKHLESGCWYLDCGRNYTPSTEIVERTAIDGGEAPVVAADDVSDEENRQVVQPPKEKKKRLTKAQKEKAEKERIAKEKADKEALEEQERAAKEKADKEGLAAKEKTEKEALAVKEKADKRALDAAEEAGNEDSDGGDETPLHALLVSHDTASGSENPVIKCTTPLAPDSSISNGFLASVHRLRKKKQSQFPCASSSRVEQKSLQVHLECTSLVELTDIAQKSLAVDPRWVQLHDCIAKVTSIPTFPSWRNARGFFNATLTWIIVLCLGKFWSPASSVFTGLPEIQAHWDRFDYCRYP
jgi:hypothetical protein